MNVAKGIFRALTVGHCIAFGWQRRHKEIFPSIQSTKNFQPVVLIFAQFVSYNDLNSLPLYEYKTVLLKKSRLETPTCERAHTVAIRIPKKQKSEISLFHNVDSNMARDKSYDRGEYLMSLSGAHSHRKERCTHSDFDWNKKGMQFFYSFNIYRD
jgi:hypothetical protein